MGHKEKVMSDVVAHSADREGKYLTFTLAERRVRHRDFKDPGDHRNDAHYLGAPDAAIMSKG